MNIASYDYRGFAIVVFGATGKALVHPAYQDTEGQGDVCPQMSIVYEANSLADAMRWVDRAEG